MPDIKTALQEALKKTAASWAADDGAHQQIEPQQEKAMPETPEKKDGRITSNVSRATFYFIRDNAGMTAEQVTKALMAQGFKATSVTSLIGQMLRMRMIMADDQGRMSAVIKEYIPVQSKPTKKHAKPAAPVQERKKVTLINPKTGEVLNPQPAPAVTPLQGVTYTPLPVLMPSPTPAEWTVDSVIGSLNVRQAMAVYDELRKIFGA